MWLLALTIISPEILMVSGHPGMVVQAELETTDLAQLQTQYPLEILSYTQNIARIKIANNAPFGNYTLTTYVIQASDASIKTGVGLPTQLQVIQTQSTQANNIQTQNIWSWILLVTISFFLTGAIRISLR
jgi:hypothetical protein